MFDKLNLVISKNSLIKSSSCSALSREMHELTGDFYTVGEILGHTLKGIGLSLGISTNMADVTARYVDVRLDRKKTVLEAYHNAMFPREAERLAAKKLSARENHER